MLTCNGLTLEDVCDELTLGNEIRAAAFERLRDRIVAQAREAERAALTREPSDAECIAIVREGMRFAPEDITDEAIKGLSVFTAVRLAFSRCADQRARVAELEGELAESARREEANKRSALTNYELLQDCRARFTKYKEDHAEAIRAAQHAVAIEARGLINAWMASTEGTSQMDTRIDAFVAKYAPVPARPSVTLSNGDVVSIEVDRRGRSVVRRDKTGAYLRGQYIDCAIWLLTTADTGADFDAVKRLASPAGEG